MTGQSFLVKSTSREKISIYGYFCFDSQYLSAQFGPRQTRMSHRTS